MSNEMQSNTTPLAEMSFDDIFPSSLYREYENAHGFSLDVWMGKAAIILKERIGDGVPVEGASGTICNDTSLSEMYDDIFVDRGPDYDGVMVKLTEREKTIIRIKILEQTAKDYLAEAERLRKEIDENQNGGNA